MKALALLLLATALSSTLAYAEPVQLMSGQTSIGTTQMTDKTSGRNSFAFKDIIEPVSADIERFRVDGYVSEGLKKAVEAIAEKSGSTDSEIYADFLKD